MFFAIYIQKLHNYIEPTTKRSEFTEKVLKMIVLDEKLIKYSDSSYNGFFDGETQGSGNDKKIIGDKICNCAKKIVGSLDESEGKHELLPKFHRYLENLQFNTTTKEELCDSFRCELPNINVDNYIDELSELLIRIIKEAAGKEVAIIDDNYTGGNEGIVSTTNNSFADNHSTVRHRTLKRRHAEKIEEIVENIEALIEPLIYYNPSYMEEEDFKLNYSRFFKLNGELFGYASMYPFIKSLQKISENIIEKTDFCICDDSFSKIEKYALFLLDIRKEIAALDEE
jgi:hypothetical protein